MLEWRGLPLAGMLFLAGCGTTPYLEAGLGHPIQNNLQGSAPSVHLEVGLTKNNYSCGLNHMSHLRDGRPVNDNWESYADTLICKGRFEWNGPRAKR